MSEKNEPLMGTPTAKRGGWRKTLERYVPILEWLPNYPWSESLMPDIAGSMTLGFVLIGQSLAHAHLCKVELINGPYSCMLPPIIYAFFGTSVHASVGTGGLVSLLTGEVLDGFGSLQERTHACCILTLLVGLLLALMGVCQMAFLVRFISKPALSGFITASALLIILSQLTVMLGLPLWARVGGIVQIAIHNPSYLQLIDWSTFSLSVVSMACLMNAKRLKQVPYFRFLNDFKELCLLICSAIFCEWYNSVATEEEKIEVVGHVPAGLPSLTSPMTMPSDFHLVKELLPGAVLVAFVVFLSSFAGAKKFAMMDGYQIRAFNELMALGFANLIGSFAGSVPTQVGLSRMGIAHGSGVKSQLGANVFVGVIVAVVVKLFSSYLYNVPMCVLAAVIVNGASHLTEFDHAKHLLTFFQNSRYNWKSRMEIVIWLVGFLVTLVFGAFPGMFTAVATSLIIILYQVVSPDIVELGYKTDTVDSTRPRKWIACAREGVEGVVMEDGILIFRLEGPLFYANVEHLQEFLEEQELHQAEGDGSHYTGIILSAGSIPFIDTTAIQALETMIQTYNKRNILFFIANTFGQTGRLVSDCLEVHMQKGLCEGLKTKMRKCASVDDFVGLIRENSAIPNGSCHPFTSLRRASFVQSHSVKNLAAILEESEI
ncbi:unnamed protein product [Polarella glacialis]|uniref:STAS domain-containing protein n=3 Tax=Polarella glacialis TaxID=89957 RepID=A0A813GKI0_POLGL|nr:unnamed protein product [Polarella glacialis]